MDLEEDDNTSRSILIGIVCTLLFHLLLVIFSPQFSLNRFSGVHSGIHVTSANKGKTFDFELAQPQKEERNQMNFVETNSAAPENTPDKTNNFSNRNQQAAQEVAAKEMDALHRASVKGQDKIQNDSAIVSGDMAKPQSGSPPVPNAEKSDATTTAEQKARAEQVPLSGFEKIEGKSEDGIAMNVSKSKSPTTHADQAVEGAHDGTQTDSGLLNVPNVSKAHPKERPRLASTSLNRSSILTNRAAGTANIGISASDAFKSEYGEYLNELIEIVQVSWWNRIEESRVSPPHGSHVVITFKINSKGETVIVKVEDADAGKQGVWLCQSAIQDPQPYRKWTEQMITLLGDEQTLTFAFYYQ
jgi:hypothetical protein